MKKIWKSIEEYQNPESVKQDDVLAEKEYKNAVLEMLKEDVTDKPTSRRSFLKLFGFSFATAAIYSSCERPVTKAIPYLIQPEEVVPGKAIHYATTYFDGNEYAGILVKIRDGRPIKIEGNPFSTITNGGSSPVVQASVLSLYDDARYQQPQKNGTKINWEQANSEIKSKLNDLKNSGEKLYLVTPTVISPSTKKLINEFTAEYDNCVWVQHDSISYSGMLEANKANFGKWVLPTYDFSKANTIVSIGADFLGTWLSPVQYARQFAENRDVSKNKDMSKLICYEANMSITGANADERIPVPAQAMKMVLTKLYNAIAKSTGGQQIQAPNCEVGVEETAEALLKNKGKSLLVCGINDKDAQILTNEINQMLGNYGTAINMNKPGYIRQGNDKQISELVNGINNGDVKAIISYDTDLAYYYANEKFTKAYEAIDFSVSVSESLNKTASLSNYILPKSNFLESWDDAEPVKGSYSLSQPVIHKLFDTKQFQEIVLNWLGKQEDYHQYIQDNWSKNILAKADFFTDAWNKALQHAVYESDKTESTSFSSAAGSVKIAQPEAGNSLLIYENNGVRDGYHGNNPWLQELPDAISKVCWTNYIAVSYQYAKENAIVNGDVLKLNNSIALPALVQPGLAKNTFAVALGYGKEVAGKVAENIGANAFKLVQWNNNSRNYIIDVESIEKTAENITLPLTQTHDNMEERPLVREATLDEYLKDPNAGNEYHLYAEKHHTTLYDEPEFKGYHWGLSVDLNKCIGCGTCITACQVENNVAVIGPEQVINRRIMHWMRLDRYYAGNPENPEVLNQPVMCQHCDNAPCENVCPVAATMHSDEGLNQIAYNRCIGTKYCINNCPYRVRRFNWFKYVNNPEFNFNQNSEQEKLVLNPDVTVRERGVVEKCTLCVQRIQEKKLEAKLENRELRDGEVQPACVQACPSGALVFGDLNNKETQVSKQFEDERNYHLLEQLHTLPSVGYMTKIKNKKA